jgi:hypothetical protein
VTAPAGPCAACPFPETCLEFGLCEDAGDPAAAGGGAPAAADARAAGIMAQLTALPAADLRAVLAMVARATPEALEVPLARFRAEPRPAREPDER